MTREERLGRLHVQLEAAKSRAEAALDEACASGSEEALARLRGARARLQELYTLHTELSWLPFEGDA